MARMAPHYRGGYKTAARHLRHAAKSNPDTTCWRCGLTARPGDPWEAGHVVDGMVGSPLAPEHRSCNRAAGARKRNAIARSKRDRGTRARW